MKVLIVGGGGREHAIIRKLRESPRVGKLYCAPGNGGIAQDAECVNVNAMDKEGMLALARENVAALELDDRVAVLECSLGTGIGEKRLGTFDAVVSNPPYVPTSVLADIPREVADYEPALALDGGADGLDVFRPLAAWAA